MARILDPQGANEIKCVEPDKNDIIFTEETQDSTGAAPLAYPPKQQGIVYCPYLIWPFDAGAAMVDKGSHSC